MNGHRAPSTYHLHLDPVACGGHGLCAGLLPEHIALDEWGYPTMDDGRRCGPFTPDTLRLARAAVDACPTLALRLERTAHRRINGLVSAPRAVGTDERGSRAAGDPPT